MAERQTNAPVKKILFLTTGLSSGGAEIMLYKLLCGMNRQRFEPIVISLMNRGTLGDRIEALGIPVYTIGMQPGVITPKLIWQVISIQKLQPDLIQGWMYHGNLAAQLAGIFQRVPVLWGIRQSLYSLDYEKPSTASVIRFSAQVSRLPNKIIYNAKTSAGHHEKIGYLSNKTLVIPNGFETEAFKQSPEFYSSVRLELGISKETILIGLMGRYHPMKDHTNFLKAATLLLKAYPGVHFVMAGEGVDKNNQPLNSLLQELGLVERSHLLGDRLDMPRLTAALDIACSASYTEGFANVIGEAMSCAVPCAVTDVGDSASIVGNTGRVVPPRHPEALANAWKELIDLGAEGRAALGQAARARVIEHFSLESVVAQYEKLYESVFAEKLNQKA